MLISFCNNSNTEDFISNRASFIANINIVTGEVIWLNIPEGIIKNINGVTGLTQDKKYIYAITQSNPSYLLKYSKNNLIFNSYIKLDEKILDAHSILYFKNKIYIVSSGNNTLFSMFLGDSQKLEKVWEYSNSKADSIHLNSVMVDKEGKMFLSCFGVKKGKLNITARDGYIFDIKTGKKVLSGINHPHSLVYADNKIYYCESATNKVKCLDKEILKFNIGYNRGLAINKNYIVTGISSSRTVSRSTGLVLNPHNISGTTTKSCLVTIYNTKTKLGYYLDFSKIHREIYCILNTDFNDKSSTKDDKISIYDKKPLYEILDQKYLFSPEEGFRQIQLTYFQTKTQMGSESMDWHYFDPQYDYQKEFNNIDPISAWVGHKYFAYDLVSNLKPKLIVELGTHKGTSFFSMCQAVKDNNLDTSLVAVDTWGGDKHTGYYGNSIYNVVKEVVETTYSGINIKLLRTLFDNAIQEFKPNTIDILHIDGLHTYVAVKHDFLNWIDRVSPNGIILFHDITERSLDFGVYRLWEELKTKYETFKFSHEHGLGILFKNKRPSININIQETWQNYYRLRHEYQLLINSSAICQKELTKIKADNKILRLELKKENKRYKQELIIANTELERKIEIIKVEIDNYTKLVNRITGSKFYKIWQLYCVLRKQK